jgi:hypothetical protein
MGLGALDCYPGWYHFCKVYFDRTNRVDPHLMQTTAGSTVKHANILRLGRG